MNIADYIKNRLPYWPNCVTRLLLKVNCLGKYCYGLSYARNIGKPTAPNPTEALLEMINYAIANVPYYRNRYSGIVIDSLQDFEQKIAFIDKDEVLAHWGEFVADGTDRSRCVTQSTGGTSGKPLILLMPANRYVNEMTNLHRHYFKFGWHYDTCAVIRNHHLPQMRDYIINPVMKQVIFDPFRMNATYAKRVHGVMKKMNIRFIHAYPSNAFQFLRLCKAQGLDLSFVKALFLSSEGITPEQQHLFEDLKIPYFSFYGHTEKLIFAGNTPSHPQEFKIAENYGYCELVEDSIAIKRTRIRGELVGTTLNNRAFPLIRYRTGDYSEYATLNNGVRSLTTIEGRREHTLIYKADGNFVPLTTLNVHGDFNRHINGLQYRQDKIGELEVLIIKGEDYSDKDEEFILNLIAKVFDNKLSSVKLTYTDRLIIQPNGKFLPLISNIAK